MTETVARVPEAPGAPPGTVESALRGTLNSRQVSFFMIAALGPLLVSGGTFPEALAAIGITAVPGACILIALVLGAFAVGYLAMAHYAPNSGAFYALVGQGLGRPAGVAAGWLALVGYCALYVSLYGIIGVQAAGFIHDNHHAWNPSWWACALAVWVLVGILGLFEVKISARVLGVLSLAEIVIVLVISGFGLAHPAHGVPLAPFNPARISWAGIGPLSAILTLCFVGFEQAPVYGPEARNPRRTLPRATAVSLAGATVIYVAASYSMDVHYGAGIVQAAGSLGSQLFFGMGQGVAVSGGHLLFLTGIIAAMLAYHNTMTRYEYSAARAHTLPAVLGRVGASGIPRAASLLQSFIGLLTICAAQLLHWDPLTQLFYVASSFGGFTIMILLAVTDVAIIAFFVRDRRGEHAATRLWTPMVTAAVLAGMVVACAVNLPSLLGVAPSDPSIARLYELLIAMAVLGLARSLYLKWRHPDSYRRLAGPPVPQGPAAGGAR